MRKKTVISFVIMFISLIAAAGVMYMVYAQLGGFAKKHGNLDYVIKDGGAVIVQYRDKQDVSDVVIPDEIDGIPVVAVAEFGFVNTGEVKTIRIGKNVTDINNWSFTNNVNLERFIVDKDNPAYTDIDGVLFTKDGKTLMYYPNRRVSAEENNKAPYEIPEGTVTISDRAFYKCGNLTRVTLPSTLRHINEGAFMYADSLESVDFPEGLLSIEKDAFSYCNRIGNRLADGGEYEDAPLVLPESLEYVGDYAFYNSVYIKKVIVNKAEAFTAENWGFKWYPVQNGDIIGDCEIVYK